MNDLATTGVKSHLTALVLAAGQSKRFGKTNKLLAKVDGKTLLSRTLDCVVRFGAGEIVVVSGHDDALIRNVAAPYQVSVVFNEHFSEGMGTSIAAGVRSLSAPTKAVAICLGDMPYIQVTTFDELLQNFVAAPESPRAIVAPRFANRRGHPVIFGHHHFPALSNTVGEQGARQMLENNHIHVIDVDVNDPGIHRDFDTHADFTQG